jgi:hypothetical protein
MASFQAARQLLSREAAEGEEMSQTDRRDIAAISAVLLWLALHAIAALPLILDPLAILKVLPIYLGGGLLLLEPLICFWAYYQYRYLLRAEPKPRQRDDLDA